VITLDVMIDESQFNIQWAILSHSWGTDRSLISTLTSANMKHMQDGIDESTLCPSFRDAIAVTRGLSLGYIWIDAMCIVQDSPTDWHAESSRMGEYYQGSEIMISALSSTSAADHMLHNRDHGPVVTIDIEGQRLGVRPLLESAASVTPYLKSYWSARQDVLHQPLSKRAWTFQEYTMAPRILHFTREQIIWQCTTYLASEDNQYSMFDNELPKSSIEKVREREWTRIADSWFEKRRYFTLKQTGWYDIIETFTSRSITYTADILPAVGAIVQQIQSYTQSEYCAGLWRGGPNTFYYNLLWETDKRYEAPVRADNGSPSWSWSSIRGRIQFPWWQGDFRVAKLYDLKVLDTHVQLTSQSSPFGKVE
jgi:hypothetical protein